MAKQNFNWFRFVLIAIQSLAKLTNSVLLDFLWQCCMRPLRLCNSLHNFSPCISVLPARWQNALSRVHNAHSHIMTWLARGTNWKRVLTYIFCTPYNVMRIPWIPWYDDMLTRHNMSSAELLRGRSVNKAMRGDYRFTILANYSLIIGLQLIKHHIFRQLSQSQLRTSTTVYLLLRQTLIN